jgi:hypothetical protein
MLGIEARPVAEVTAVPTYIPFNSNEIIRPSTGPPWAVKVAESVVTPSKVPVAFARSMLV